MAYTKKELSIPKSLPLLIVGNGVLLPGVTNRIPISNSRNVNLVRSRLISKNWLSSTVIGVATQEPDTDNVHKIGTAGIVVQVTGSNWDKPTYSLLITGICRIRIDSIIQEHPYTVANVTKLSDTTVIDNDALEKLMGKFKEALLKFLDILDINDSGIPKLKAAVLKVPDKKLADIVAGLIQSSIPEKLQILDALDLSERLKIALPLLLRHIEKLKEAREIQPKDGNDGKEIVRFSRAKPRLLGPPNSPTLGDSLGDIGSLEERLKAAGLPPEADKIAMKELARLKRMAPHIPEHSMLKTYLELVADLPWNKSAPDSCNIKAAREHLDMDHYGLDKVKRRVLEFLAVGQLRGDLKGPILCFVGPPGVGKTSIAKSIATTLGRPYSRMSLGGVSDQHDIRGHRRTYIGAMPGRVIQAMRNAKVKNPVLLLDEIDKLGHGGIHGDPSAALLEVLDPAQNSTFTDTYLALPFDLSQVLFVATANNLRTIPTPLLDRMEIISVPGYTQEEKVMIAHLHLLPKQLFEHGLSPSIFDISKELIASIIGEYTREAGVRNLERKLSAMCRAVAVRVAEALSSEENIVIEEQNEAERKEQEPIEFKNEQKEADNEFVKKEGKKSEEEKIENEESVEDNIGEENKIESGMKMEINISQLQKHFALPIVADQNMIQDVLGPPIFSSSLAGRVSVPGVAVGLAWTPTGGDVLVVEATRSRGDTRLILTGQLGSVMQESAKIALSWVRHHATMLDLEPDFMKDEELHLHFPAGAISKDGPSAGVTILTVLVSLFTQRCVRPDVAMTGEITLNGVVLPVGGIKAKVLAAHRAGLKTVILPSANTTDIKEIPDSVLSEVDIVFVDSVEEVLQVAFENGFNVETTKALTSKL